MVVHGTVHIENLDLWGTKSILSSIVRRAGLRRDLRLLRRRTDGGCCCGRTLQHTVAAHCRVLTDARIEPAVQDNLLRNLLAVSMRKNLSLSQRIFCTTPKTVRGRLLTYYPHRQQSAGRMEFEVPFNRQQNRRFLNLDRSALSKELCKMRDEGLLEFEKNHFV